MTEAVRLRQTEIWIAWIRVLAVPFAVFEIAWTRGDYPPGYEQWGIAASVALGIGSVAFFWLAHRDLDLRGRKRIGALALAFDTAIV